MGRPPRVHIPGCIYHVIARGNARAPIFVESPGDFLRFLDLIDEARRRYGHRLHAYCLMTNHVHLLVQMAAVPVSAFAHHLMARYARWQNGRLGRSGHLFERRHRAILVRTDDQLRRLLRYVHRNPVRASMVEGAASYRWSSYHAYAGRPTDIDVTTETGLRALHEVDAHARELFRALVEQSDEEIEATPLPELRDGCESLAAAEADVRLQCVARHAPLGGVAVLLAATVEASGCSFDELLSRTKARRIATARGAAALIAYEHPRLKLSELAAQLGRDASTLSEAASGLRRRLLSDPEAERLVRAIRQRLGMPPPAPADPQATP